MLRKALFSALAFCSLAFTGFSQVGGSSTFGFLNMPFSARTAAMGGALITPRDNDVFNGYANPSLLNPEMHNQFGLTTGRYFADIAYNFATYARDYSNKGTFAVSIQNFNYGRFIGADAAGKNDYGDFTVSDNALTIGWGKQIDSLFSVGANLKTLYSNYQQYKSVAIAADVAATYRFRNSNLVVAMVFKNMGIQLQSYMPGEREPLPFDVQMAITKKLAKAPIRFTLLLHDLNRFDLTYKDPVNPNTSGSLFGDDNKSKAGNTAFDKALKVVDKGFRHMIVSAEILLSKNFNFRLGYNYQRMKELSIVDRRGTAGISWGLGFRISKFHISYGRATYHLAGASNTFSLVTNLSDFVKKKSH